MFFAMKAKMPKARTKNRMKVPRVPAPDLRARSQMIKSMKPIKPARPKGSKCLRRAGMASQPTQYGLARFADSLSFFEQR